MRRREDKYLKLNKLLVEQVNDLIILKARDGLKALDVTEVVKLAGLTKGKTAARTAGTREDFKVFINCIFLEIILILIYNF